MYHIIIIFINVRIKLTNQNTNGEIFLNHHQKTYKNLLSDID